MLSAFHAKHLRCPQSSFLNIYRQDSLKNDSMTEQADILIFLV